MTKRVCIVGAGPCGMSALYHFGQIDKPPEVVCYEKQGTWSGLWNFTWRTGTDEFGEPSHGAMYKHLWSNGPKECLEFPDYTFEMHFGKAIPSFPPREVLRDYLEGRWTNTSKSDLKKMIKFNHVVRYVRYDKTGDEFVVTVCDLKSITSRTETFSHFIVAVGIFNVPNMPNFDGIDTFPGRIIHAHDFRNANQFKDQRLLIVGASYSAEDIALQCLKYGAKSALCTWRSKPMWYKWPVGIEERPLVKKFQNSAAIFKDGNSSEFDSIILSTGYKYHFPFLEDDLRLVSSLTLYPDNLYKGTLWTKGGNRKLFYLGVQVQYYTYTMFEILAICACKYIMETLPEEILSATDEAVEAHISEWVQRCNALEDTHQDIDFQTAFVHDLCQDTGYDSRVTESAHRFHTLEYMRDDNIATYRDMSFASIFTGTLSPKHVPWFQAFDDSIEAFVN